jgi:hypothetical protein
LGASSRGQVKSVESKVWETAKEASCLAFILNLLNDQADFFHLTAGKVTMNKPEV